MFSYSPPSRMLHPQVAMGDCFCFPDEGLNFSKTGQKHLTHSCATYYFTTWIDIDKWFQLNHYWRIHFTLLRIAQIYRGRARARGGGGGSAGASGPVHSGYQPSSSCGPPQVMAPCRWSPHAGGGHVQVVATCRWCPHVGDPIVDFYLSNTLLALCTGVVTCVMCCVANCIHESPQL